MAQYSLIGTLKMGYLNQTTLDYKLDFIINLNPLQINYTGYSQGFWVIIFQSYPLATYLSFHKSTTTVLCSAFRLECFLIIPSKLKHLAAQTQHPLMFPLSASHTIPWLLTKNKQIV